MILADRHTAAWRIAFAVAACVHLAALYWPRVVTQLPQGSDKLVHLVLFMVPAFVGVVATGRWWPAVALAGHAPVSEYIQGSWFPGRSGSVADVVADLVGVAVGVALAGALRRRAAGAAHRNTAAEPSAGR